MSIRTATDKDFDSIWEIFHRVIQKEDTYVFPKDTPKTELKRHWLAEHMQTYVLELDHKIVGTYIIKPNQLGAGSHIANGSYMVHPEFQNQGFGSQLCEHSIEQAKEKGYRGLQFNIVVSTNLSAVKLWKKFGFEIIGTTPGGFLHPVKGYIDSLIMFKSLL